MRISNSFALSLATLHFGLLVLIPSPGSASMTKNCPTEPTTDVPIVSGETYWGSNCVLRTTGDVDSFQFTASAGDTWSMVLGLGASPPTDICLTLYAPGSTTPLFSGCTHVYSYPYGEHSVATSEKLKVAGLYTAVVTETSDAVVTYGLSLERLKPAPPDGIALALAKSITGEVTPPTAQDAYSFYGDTSGTYEIAASLTSTLTQDVCIQVYSAGTSVAGPACTHVYSYPYGVYSVSEDVTPTLDGTDVVVVSAAGDDANVDYNLELSCLLGTCSSAPPPPCTLEDTATYDATTSTLTMNFTVGNNEGTTATWNAWLTNQNTILSLPGFPVSQPITVPAKHYTETYTDLSREGTVGVLSTLTTPKKGIACSSWVQIATGTP